MKTLILKKEPEGIEIHTVYDICRVCEEKTRVFTQYKFKNWYTYICPDCIRQLYKFIEE